MASIYEIETFTTAHVWYINDVTFNSADSRAYYAVKQQNNTPSLASTDWGGWITYDNKTIPHFFWTPSYSPTFNNEPTVRSVKFGDGYEQRTPEGINSNLLKVSLNFDKRAEKEATAIAHFLHARGGAESFAYLPPSPYSSMKKFVCRKWDVAMTFDNNYAIKVDLEEVVE